ncbi:transposase [Buttiauxella sp. B2]|uniref:IS3 family transposase n=1 Tax=Buttiauxella sp. B2 TaxID=2587812 RepID=UPI0011237660|nr:transposase [Buttiauxella sp. B2]
MSWGGSANSQCYNTGTTAAKHIHAEIDATYGSRRMCMVLREQDFSAGRYRVRQIIKSLLLVAKRPGHYRPVNISPDKYERRLQQGA